MGKHPSPEILHHNPDSAHDLTPGPFCGWLVLGMAHMISEPSGFLEPTQSSQGSYSLVSYLLTLLSPHIQSTYSWGLSEVPRDPN